MIYKIVFYFNISYTVGIFFTDPDPDLWPIRIRTQKKSLIRIRKKTGSETLNTSTGIS